jgi:arylsulfatase A-like enzyme
MIHVPLLMRFPGGGAAGTRVAGVARQIDILPTVLDYLALPVPTGLPGRSLLSSLEDGRGRPIDALAETGLGRQSVAAVVIGEWKVIETKTTGTATTGVYNVARDAQERDDCTARHPVLLGYARQAWATAAFGAGTPADARAAEPAVDPAIMERLRALGYSE